STLPECLLPDAHLTERHQSGCSSAAADRFARTRLSPGPRPASYPPSPWSAPLLMQNLAVHDRRRTVLKLHRAGGKHLHVLQDQVADICFRNRSTHRVAMCVVADIADRDDPRQSARDLVERETMDVRVKPEQAGPMISGNFDTVIDRVHHDRSVLVRRLWLR